MNQGYGIWWLAHDLPPSLFFDMIVKARINDTDKLGLSNNHASEVR
jgi:hypothetical protein